jgi:hypothetical protein
MAHLKVSQEEFTKVFNENDLKKDWFGPERKALNLFGGHLAMLSNPKEIAGTLARLIKSLVDLRDGFRITFEGDTSFCSVDGRQINLTLNTMSLPLPTVDKAKVLFGHFLHEVGHQKFTNPDATKFLGIRQDASVADFNNAFSSISPLLRELTNIYEDKRIERELARIYPGYKQFLAHARKEALVEGYFMNIESVTRNAVGNWVTTEDSSPVSLDWDKALMSYAVTNILFPSDDLVSEYEQELHAVVKASPDFEKIDALVKATPVSYLQVVKLSKALAKFFSKEANKQGMSKQQKGQAKSSKQCCVASESGEGEKTREAEALTTQLKQALQKEFESSSDKEISAEDIKTQIEKQISGNVKDAESTTLKGGKFKAVSECYPEAFRNYAHPHFFAFPPVSRPVDEASRDIERLLKRDFQAYSTVMLREKEIYEQEEGELDDEDIYMVKFNRDIFMDSEQTEEGNLLEVIALVDASGSMHGESIQLARKLVVGLGLAFSKNSSVLFSAYAHTADCGTGGLQIAELYAKGTKFDVNKLLALQAKSNNADGFAISFAASKFEKNSKSKMLIVISDGQPAASRYGGSAANHHTRKVVQECKQRGIKVLSLAVKDYYQEEIYDKEDIIEYHSPQQASKDMIQWIQKNFRSKMQQAIL